MDAEALLRRIAAGITTTAGAPSGHTPDPQATDGRLTHLRVLGARKARTAVLPPDLPPLLVNRLQRVGITWLYQHQADALAHVRAGRSVVVATGTASGKSLCYQLPILEQALRPDDPTTLYLGPTKALARDQLRQLRAFGLPHVRPAVYDGDTPRGERDAVRRTANALLTNPDMLHVGMLPSHRRWEEFLRRLALVVVDECHVARGIFGSHVAAVLRRLLRVTDHYAADPVLVLTSATIGNPGAHATALTGVPVEAVTEDAAPAPRRAVALWSPPLVAAGPARPEGDGLRARRRSTLTEAADVMAALVAQDTTTVTFVGSRKGAEVLAAATRRRLDGDDDGRGPRGAEGTDVPGPEPAGVGGARIAVYRAGLLPAERRAVETGLATGRILGVAATDALELGVDVGGLDAVVIAGWPGTVASLWQQAGRAGRRERDAAVVFIADDDPLDRYLLDHPDELFNRSPEHAVVDVTNDSIAAAHLRCAAAELPLADAEPRLAPIDVLRMTEAGIARGDLVRRSGRVSYAGRRPPAPEVNLRTTGGRPIEIVAADTGQLVGVVDRPRAPETVHAGAVYLHQGAPWRVRHLDLQAGRAEVEPDDGTTMTSVRTDTDLVVLEEQCAQQWDAGRLVFGAVEVSRHVLAYERRHLFTGESYGLTELDLPPQRLVTQAVWLTLPAHVTAAVPVAALPGAAHAAEHAAIGLLPLFAMCDRWDIGGVSTPWHPDTAAATIFIYDGHPGGAGIARRGFATGARLWRATTDAIAGCPCVGGCPSCVQSPKCGNGNRPLDKDGALALLRAALASR